MKRILSGLLTVCLLAALLTGAALAVDSSRSYDFDLASNGSHTITAATGDIITVTLTLRRTDSAAAADIYGMQDEIRYDDAFFEIVEGGSLLTKGVASTDIALRGGDRAFYLNFVSLSGGESWQANTLVGSFQVRVLGTSGSSTLKNENCLVSVKDGSDTYTVTVQDLTVTVSDKCTVRFDPVDGGEAVEETVTVGSLLKEPQNITREGYRVSGWYTDFDRTQPWNFETDTVQGNMTLYAAWETVNDAENGGSGLGWLWALLGLLGLGLLILLFLLLTRRTVSFETCGGGEIDDVKVIRGAKLKRVENPVKPGVVFGGWYTEREGGKRWRFDEDKVTKDMTLFAHWL